MEIFDTHFHYYGEETPQQYYSNLFGREGVDSQVETIWLLAAGADYAESIAAQKFAAAIPQSVFAAGVHPHSATEYKNSKNDFSAFWRDPKLCAVGEIGLDYYYDNSVREDQLTVFETFLETALAVDKVAVVHLRDKDGVFTAYEEGYALLKSFSSRGGRMHVHCFSGTEEWARKFLDLGACLGVTGMVTFPKAENIRALVRMMPLDRLLIETDSPYLAPVPFRGRTNDPGYLIYAAQMIAKVLSREVEEICRITCDNAFRLYALKKAERDGTLHLKPQ